MFIHFASWHDNDHINTIKNKFVRGIVIKIVYDEPWFWKCSLNRTPTSHNRNNTSMDNTSMDNTSMDNTSMDNTDNTNTENT